MVSYWSSECHRLIDFRLIFNHFWTIECHRLIFNHYWSSECHRLIQLIFNHYRSSECHRLIQLIFNQSAKEHRLVTQGTPTKTTSDATRTWRGSSKDVNTWKPTWKLWHFRTSTKTWLSISSQASRKSSGRWLLKFEMQQSCVAVVM